MAGCSVLRAGPVLVANEIRTEARELQLLCPPAQVLPGVIPASADFSPVTELRWEQKGRGDT